MIDIVGSSKDVNALYREIESKMIESFDFSNEGFDFFKDKITWPPQYQKAIKINFPNEGKNKRLKLRRD